MLFIILLQFTQSVEFSLSGFSAGAFMTMQMHFAHSSSVTGAGIVAGGPYHCGQTYSISKCTDPPAHLDIEPLILYAQSQEQLKKIDALFNLKASKVWIMGGTKDKIVTQMAVRKVSEIYEYFGADVEFVIDIESHHGFVTDSFGNLCGVYAWPYINNCQYDSAGEILHKIYGELIDRTPYIQRHLYRFDQQAFGSDSVGMADSGYIYVPESCWANTCKLHMFLHGCGMNTDYIGNYLIKYSGFNSWAESNSIIILYPQAARHHKINHSACWDASGSWDKDYSTKNGKQLSVLFNMTQNVPFILKTLLLKSLED